MSARDGGDLGALKRRLEKLEEHLRDLAEAAQKDVEIAGALQRLMMKNRLPGIPGLRSYARYVCAGQVSSEAFDLIPTQNNRELWIVSSWTESFGLSSALLQALVHLQGLASLQGRSDLPASQIFNEVTTTLADAHRSGLYRLMVAKIDMASLRVEGYSAGMPPFLMRKKEGARFQPYEFCGSETFDAEFLQPAHTKEPKMAPQAFSFRFSFPPGARLYFLSPSWNQEALGLEEWVKPLGLVEQAKVPGDLLDDFNHMLAQAEKSRDTRAVKSDIVCLGFELDARKLHLA